MGQAEMARKLDVTPVTAWRWESGRAGIPLDQLRSIAELLNAPLSELVPDDEGVGASVPPVADDPEEYVRLAQLALAAAHGGDEAKQKLNDEVLDRARRLKAAALRDVDEG